MSKVPFESFRIAPSPENVCQFAARMRDALRQRGTNISPKESKYLWYLEEKTPRTIRWNTLRQLAEIPGLVTRPSIALLVHPQDLASVVERLEREDLLPTLRLEVIKAPTDLLALRWLISNLRYRGRTAQAMAVLKEASERWLDLAQSGHRDEAGLALLVDLYWDVYTRKGEAVEIKRQVFDGLKSFLLRIPPSPMSALETTVLYIFGPEKSQHAAIQALSAAAELLSRSDQSFPPYYDATGIFLDCAGWLIGRSFPLPQSWRELRENQAINICLERIAENKSGHVPDQQLFRDPHRLAGILRSLLKHDIHQTPPDDALRHAWEGTREFLSDKDAPECDYARAFLCLLLAERGVYLRDHDIFHELVEPLINLESQSPHLESRWLPTTGWHQWPKVYLAKAITLSLIPTGTCPRCLDPMKGDQSPIQVAARILSELSSSDIFDKWQVDLAHVLLCAKIGGRDGMLAGLDRIVRSCKSMPNPINDNDLVGSFKIAIGHLPEPKRLIVDGALTLMEGGQRNATEAV